MAKESTSMFIGETTGGIARPVLFDTHTQIYNNKPPMTLITGAPGSGKDLDIDTPIPTPYGFVAMGDLRTGDRVLDRFSRPCRVTFAGEIKERDVFTVTFSDGRSLVAGKDHQFAVNFDAHPVAVTKDRNAVPAIRLRLSGVFESNRNAVVSMQKNATALFALDDWATIEDFSARLIMCGASFYTPQEVARVMKSYAVLKTQKDSNKPGYTHTCYNVFMALQAVVEDSTESALNALHGDKIVTTRQLVAWMRKNPGAPVHIRTAVASTDYGDEETGYLAEGRVDSFTKDITPFLMQTNEEKDYGSVATRIEELRLIVEEAFAFESKKRKNNAVSFSLKDYVLAQKDGITFLPTDSKRHRARASFLAHSLGLKVVRDSQERVGIDLRPMFDDSQPAYNFVAIASIERAEKRKTRCISVDSKDHVYLAGEGFVPTHNTFFAMTITCLSAVLGKTTVVLDPKGDFLSLSELKGDIGEVSFWALKDRKKAGILDPFYMAKRDGEKLSLVLEVLSLFLGGLTNDQLQILSPIIKDTIEEEVPSLLLLKENLEMSPEKAARAIGAQLDIISKLPFASLCFAPGSVRQKEISIDEGVTIVTMAGLELSTSDEHGTGPSGNKARLSSAVFFLITDFIRRFMHDSDDTMPKTIIIDEAWAVLATDEGARVVKEIALLARSKNLALVLITQNTSHLEKIDVENTISTRFAFRTAEREGKTITENMGLPKDEGFENILIGLDTGECLMQDWRQRYSTVQISQYNTRWKKAFETNPLEKRKKREALKKQKEAQARAKARNGGRH